MEMHQSNDLKKPITPQNSELETVAAGSSAKNVTVDEQTEQLGSLARVVMSTLGLTVEEARQMADDLGFLKF
jgi:hypothetical protein